MLKYDFNKSTLNDRIEDTVPRLNLSGVIPKSFIVTGILLYVYTVCFVISKPVGCNKRNSKRDVHNNRCLHQEARKISNRKPNPIPKETRRRRTN